MAHETDHAGVRYRERLWPQWWVWILVGALAAVLGTAYGAAYDALLGWAIFAVAALIGAAFLVLTAPAVHVDGREISAGIARLPLEHVGDVQALDSTALTEVRRRGDARAYLVLRPWSSSRGVQIEVRDDEDPHPYWLVSTRRPDQLVAVLTAGPGEARSRPPEGDPAQ